MATYYEFDAEGAIAPIRPGGSPSYPGTLHNITCTSGLRFPLATEHFVSSAPRGGLVDYFNKERVHLHDMVSGNRADVPSNFSKVLLEERHTAPSKMKDFKKKQDEGIVVLNPMRAVKVNSTFVRKVRDYVPFSKQGIGSLTFPNGSKTHPIQLGASEKVGVCGRPATAFTYQVSDPIFTLDGDWITRFDNVVWSNTIPFKRYNVTAEDFSFADERLVRTLVHHIISRLDELKPDARLVTTVTAEANQGSFDLATELAEARETVSWIFGLLRAGVELVVSTRQAIKDLRKGRKGGAAVLADNLASVWMQFRYAFTPLQMSVNDGLDTLMSSFAPYQTYRSGRSFDLDINVPDHWEISPIEVVERCYLKRRHEMHVLHDVQFNVAKAAWEVYPLAFVVDWILNIGDLLSALQTPSNVVDQAMQSSYQVRKPVQIKTPEGTVQLGLNYYRARPIEPLQWVGLGVEANISWKRWIDALALSWGFSKSLLTKTN